VSPARALQRRRAWAAIYNYLEHMQVENLKLER
jgi:hypothetical protein